MRPEGSNWGLMLIAFAHIACGSGSGSGNVSGTGGSGGTGTTGNLATQIVDVSGRVDGAAIHDGWAFLATEEAVLVYSNATGSWAPHSQISPPTSDTSFVGPIDTDGTTLGVLATTAEVLPNATLHHIELRRYELASDAWVEQLVVEVDGGETLALDGDLAAVGDPEGPDGTAITGVVHMVRRDGSTGVITTLKSAGAIGGSDIGERVALHAGVTATTCRGIFCDDDKIHVWTENGTDWDELPAIYAPTGAEGTFGSRIALHSGLLLVSLYPNEDEGSVLAYDVASNSWKTGITPNLPFQWVADEMDFDGQNVALGGTIQDPNDRDLSNFPKQHGKRLDVYRREGDGWANVGYEERNAVLSLRDLAMQGNAGVAVWSSNDLSQQEIEFFAVP